jgi:hypothetical protein
MAIIKTNLLGANSKRFVGNGDLSVILGSQLDCEKVAFFEEGDLATRIEEHIPLDDPPGLTMNH